MYPEYNGCIRNVDTIHNCGLKQHKMASFMLVFPCFHHFHVDNLQQLKLNSEITYKPIVLENFWGL